MLLGANDWADLGQTIRIAGGWVRDKLLGITTNDVDCSIDTMTGAAFVETLRGYVDAHRRAGVGVRGEPIPEHGLGRGYLVAENIQRSKHLETAGLSIAGLKIELVHLRSETYAEGSRVPTVEFGDALTDAKRRDLTINSLFYRLDTGEIEDHTGGLADLAHMRLRTPLAPKQTFLDDPLRVLRVLRFRSRFAGSTIDKAALDAMTEPDIRTSYQTKVAPERAAPELLKLFAGAEPAPPLRSMCGARLASAVFGISAFDQAGPRRIAPEAAGLTTARLRESDLTQERRALGGLAAFLWSGLRASDESQQQTVARINAALKPIGVSKTDRLTVQRAASGAHLFSSEVFSNLTIGRLVLETDPDAAKQGAASAWVWKLAGAAAEAAAQLGGLINTTRISPEEIASRHAKVRGYLASPPPLGPLIGGDELMKLFPHIPPRTGFIRVVQDLLLEKQLAKQITEVDGARRFVAGLTDGEILG